VLTSEGMTMGPNSKRIFENVGTKFKKGIRKYRKFLFSFQKGYKENVLYNSPQA
jgi:hypothetical protein